MTGKWQGICKVSSSFKNQNQGKSTSTDSALVVFYIHDDHSVSGTAGGAKLTECRLKKNRGWLVRLLRMKTDYIIIGNLKGAIVQTDTIASKSIKIPFNRENNRIKGTLFRIYKWKYPDPLVRINLNQIK